MKVLACVLLAAVAAAACARDELSVVTRQAAPHSTDFVRFESWARRTLSAHVELRDLDARQEVLFAPLALERHVTGARVVAGDEEYVLRRGVGAPQDWRVVRVGGEELEVAAVAGTVVLGRSGALGGRMVRVEVGFREP